MNKIQAPAAPGKAAGRNMVGVFIVLAAAISISFSNIMTPAVVDSGSNIPTLLIFRFVLFLLGCGLVMRLTNTSLHLAPHHWKHCTGAGMARQSG